jgi:hypothetical protein
MKKVVSVLFVLLLLIAVMPSGVFCEEKAEPQKTAGAVTAGEKTGGEMSAGMKAGSIVIGALVIAGVLIAVLSGPGADAPAPIFH